MQLLEHLRSSVGSPNSQLASLLGDLRTTTVNLPGSGLPSSPLTTGDSDLRALQRLLGNSPDVSALLAQRAATATTGAVGSPSTVAAAATTSLLNRYHAGGASGAVASEHLPRGHKRLRPQAQSLPFSSPNSESLALRLLADHNRASTQLRNSGAAIVPPAPVDLLGFGRAGLAPPALSDAYRTAALFLEDEQRHQRLVELEMIDQHLRSSRGGGGAERQLRDEELLRARARMGVSHMNPGHLSNNSSTSLHSQNFPFSAQLHSQTLQSHMSADSSGQYHHRSQSNGAFASPMHVGVFEERPVGHLGRGLESGSHTTARREMGQRNQPRKRYKYTCKFPDCQTGAKAGGFCIIHGEFVLETMLHWLVFGDVCMCVWMYGCMDGWMDVLLKVSMLYLFIVVQNVNEINNYLIDSF
jgi:hypothetical protein